MARPKRFNSFIVTSRTSHHRLLNYLLNPPQLRRRFAADYQGGGRRVSFPPTQSSIPLSILGGGARIISTSKATASSSIGSGFSRKHLTCAH
ncbi:hypothetical protein B0H10DRAFT_2036785 [Mycena sp. CBHHK59/15]|nr:hypothetical protein B0H10DRAFT_2099340 [Mycena sp. CBHHK59/15]KAJ6616577.1 hypothetical protein B0H10DRAFT_2036785 [Mycena sp. CBHHK59/15]